MSLELVGDMCAEMFKIVVTIISICLIPGSRGAITVIFEDRSEPNVSCLDSVCVRSEEIQINSNFTKETLEIRWVSFRNSNTFSSYSILSEELTKESNVFLVIGSLYSSSILQKLASENNKRVYAFWPISPDITPHCVWLPKTRLDASELAESRHDVINFRLYSIGSGSDSKIIVAMLEELNWSSLVVFYDNETEERVKDLSDALLNIDCKLLMYNIDSEQNIDKILSTSYEDVNYGQRQFLVLCSPSGLQTVIYHANVFDRKNDWKTAMRQLSKWLIFASETSLSSLKLEEAELDNIALMVTPQTPPEIKDTAVIKESLKYNFKTAMNHITSDTLNYSDSSTLMIEQFIEPFLTCGKAIIYTLLWKSDGRVANAIGVIDHDFKLVRNHDVFPNTKYGFNNRSFTVATNTWAPFVEKKTINNKVVYTGFCMDLLKELASAMNFSFTIVEPADGQWGVEENGTWTGLVGQIINREVDLIVAPIVTTSERLEVMDFSFPFFHDYTAVLFKMPDPNRSKWRKLVDPFKWHVFVCILMSFVTLTILYYTLERLNPFYQTMATKRHSLLDMVIYVFGAMLTQGGPNQPRSASGRFLIAFWWLFSIIVAATYSGNLIAFLTVAKDKPPFETLADLANQDEYKWGTLGGTNWVSFLQSSKGNGIENLWRGLVQFNKTDPDVLSTSTAVHINKVGSEQYAYIADRGMLEIEMARKCDWVFLKELFYPLQYAVGLPMKSPYYKLFYDEMLRIYETGLLLIWKRRWWPAQETCKEALITEVRKIELVDLQSAFYVIGIGVVFSSLIMFLENAVVFLRRRSLIKLHHLS